MNIKELFGGELDPAQLRQYLEEHPYSHLVRLASMQASGQDPQWQRERGLDEAAVNLPMRSKVYDIANGDSVPVAGIADIPEAGTEEDLTVTGAGSQEHEREVVQDKASQDETSVPLSTEIVELEKLYVTEAVQSTIIGEVQEVDLAEIEEPKKADARKSIETEEPKSFLDFISGTSEKIKEEALQENELITQFLKGTGEKVKQEFFSAERMAKKSLEDKGGIVSDTLARIYVNQGNYDKAIDAYERLILKYPEKSDYFAARIEKVKDLKRIKRK